MKIYLNAIGAVVEGEADELLAAGVLRPDDRIPRRSPGHFKPPSEGWHVLISRLRNGDIRVRGRWIEAARADEAFRRFLARATTGGIK